MKYIIKCKKTKNTFKMKYSGDFSNYKKLSGCIKTSCSRRGINWEDIAYRYIDIKSCMFCGNNIISGHFICEYDGNDTITILDYERLDDLYYCRQKGCSGKSLNANSVEFVMKSRKVSKDDAINIIHSRNRTPFYRINHQSNEEYSKQQNVFLRLTDKQKQKIVDKQNFSRSLNGYIQKYGEYTGTTKYYETQKKKGLNIDFWKNKYGDKWNLYRNEWIDKTKQTEDNFIKRYGNDKGTKLYKEYKNLVLKKTIESKTKNGNMYGIIAYTDKGEILRSSHEIHFYELMKRFDLHKENYKIETNYPNSLKRCDFYFEDIDLYIEIAGMMRVNWYKESMDYKQKTFGCMIVEPHDDMIKICKTIKEKLDAI